MMLSTAIRSTSASLLAFTGFLVVAVSKYYGHVHCFTTVHVATVQGGACLGHLGAGGRDEQESKL